MDFLVGTYVLYYIMKVYKSYTEQYLHLKNKNRDRIKKL